MATTINADTSNGLVITPDTSGELEFQSNGTQVLKVTGANGSFDIPVGTTAQRPSSPATGTLRYNTDNSAVETYTGSAWESVGVIADGAITTAKVADSAITTAKIADDAITSAKIAANAVDSTALNVSGNGTSGQVLTSDADGSFSWADAGGGAWELIAGGTNTGYSGTHAFTGLGSYKFVRAYIQVRTNSNPSGGSFYCQVSANNGSSYYASNGHYVYAEMKQDNTTASYTSSNSGGVSNSWKLFPGSNPPGLNWTGGAMLILDFHMADKCALDWKLVAPGNWNHTDPRYVYTSGSGSLTQTVSCNAFKIVHSASMSLVDYKILGVK